jgi:hypothetical protein
LTPSDFGTPQMKIIDISAFDIVKTGIEFQVVTSSKESSAVAELLPNMERNESAVFWLQPKHGTVEQQEACICVNGNYYALNSKFEKAIFRNVRLTRDFKNLERLVDGTRKLVIPRRLFYEKLRTSRRVRPLTCLFAIVLYPALCRFNV